jgi:translation initiation factor 5
LDKFIQTFVLCPTCKLPEIKMQVKSSKITIDCAACGHNSVLKTSHKLSTYIIKNPPTKIKGGAAAPNKTAEVDEEADAQVDEERHKKKAAHRTKAKEDGKEDETAADPKAASGAPATAAAAAAGNGADAQSNGSATPTSPSIPATSAAAIKKPEGSTEPVWFTDTSDDAQKARQDSEFAEMKKLDDVVKKSIAAAVGSGKASGKIESPVAVLKIYLALNTSRTTEEIFAELKRIALARGLDDRQRCSVLLDATLGDVAVEKLSEALTAQVKVLKRLTREKNGSAVLLGCLESLLGANKKLLARTPHVFQTLYEAEVLSEEAILAWAEAPAESSWVNKDVAASVRKKAGPFITWLKTAEEDD